MSRCEKVRLWLGSRVQSLGTIVVLVAAWRPPVPVPVPSCVIRGGGNALLCVSESISEAPRYVLCGGGGALM